MNNLPILISLGTWLLAIIIHYLQTKKIKLNKFAFSERNYYIMMSGFILSVLYNTLTSHSIAPLLIFIIFGITGVIGETIFSIWWHYFFGKKFWEYQIDTMFNSYTSLLNFIPWGIGGMLYIQITNQFFPANQLSQFLKIPNTYTNLGFLFMLSISLQYILFYILHQKNNPSYKFHQLTLGSYLLFLFPSLTVMLFFLIKGGTQFLTLSILFGIIATTTEYLFGKATQFFISKKMWTYNYATFDHGHFTPLTIPAFILAGYYFLLINNLLNKYLPT